MGYRSLLEQRLDEWENGHGVVQIVMPEDSDEHQLRSCYYKDGEFVNRPLTISSRKDTAERTGEIIETVASLVRTFTPDEIEALVEELGEKKNLELPLLIEELGKSRMIEILQEESGWLSVCLVNALPWIASSIRRGE